ncbi:MAG: EAL domain-containing protein [Actinomycetota bacterium]
MPAFAGAGVAVAAMIGIRTERVPELDAELAALATGLAVTLVVTLLVVIQRRLGSATYTHLRSLEHQARYDHLTGLPARIELLDRLDAALRDVYRRDGHVGVLFLDLDGFKAINDSMGHETGDVVLRAFARRLRGAVRAHDVVGRFGGDEFVVVCSDLTSPHQARDVANKVLEAFDQPLAVEDGVLRVVPSIGLATAGRSEPASSAELISHADQAMYRAKNNGGGVERFGRRDRRDELDRMEVEQAILPALADGQFGVHYQPIVSDQQGVTVGVEGLIRWLHPEHGVLGPDRFLAIAEESGLAARLGDVVLREVVAQTAIWNHLHGRARLQSAINLAERQLVDPAFPERVLEIARWGGISPQQLDLEISEELLLRRVDDAGQVIRRLADLGCRIVIDDFGNGQGAFNRIRSLDLVSVVKIDGTVVANVLDDEISRTVIEATVSMAEALNVEVVAEGVETFPQQQALRDLGVDLMQGYLFQRPASAETFGHDAAALGVDLRTYGGSSNRSSRSSNERGLMNG